MLTSFVDPYIRNELKALVDREYMNFIPIIAVTREIGLLTAVPKSQSASIYINWRRTSLGGFFPINTHSLRRFFDIFLYYTFTYMSIYYIDIINNILLFEIC